VKNYAILRDAVEEKVFGLVIEQDGGYRFYGADDRAKEWATWANSTSLKSLQEALPVGVTINDRRPLVNDTELFIESLIESASNSGEMKKSTFSYKGSHVAGVESSTPSARDFQLRSFDINARKNAINFKVFAFKNDQKSSSLMAKIRSTGLGFNEKTGEFRSNDITISNLSLQQNIENTYAKSLQRNIGFNIMAAKNIYAKSLAPFYTHPNVVELKRLGGAIGPKLGRGLRSAPMGMVFVDVTGAIDADKDGIVFEGKPGLERPIIPKFILPEGVGRRVASLIGGAAEQNEKNRRSGIVGGGAIDEAKLRSILGTDASSLNNLNASSPLNDGDNADADGMRSIAGNIRSRRDAIIAKRRGSTNLSRVGTGEKTQLNTGDSRAVEKMTWDDSAKELIVTFAGGRTYTYNNVDDSWVDELEKNPDALGRIMNDIKKAGYDFTPGGTHAPDKTLASRMQGRREAAGMRSRVTAGEIGVLDSDRYKSKRNPPPLTDREKEIVDLVDAPRKFELEDRESLEIQIANHVAKTRDAIYDAILTGDINEEEASEFLDEMSSNLTKPLNAVYGNEPNWRSSNESDEFLNDFAEDANKRFKRAAETYSSVRKLRKNTGNGYGDIATYITPLNEYLDGKDMDGHSLLGSYPSGQLKLESIIDNYVIDEIDALIESGKDALDANHEEAYEEFANSMREMVGNLNPEDYPSGLAEYVDKALEIQKEWFFDSINTLVNENANARADAVMRGIGMSSRREPASPDATTDFDRIYGRLVDMTGYDTELGPKGAKEVSNIIHNRWKKATRKERQDYIASEGNATDGAMALASDDGLLDDFDFSNPLDSMTPNQRLGMSSSSEWTSTRDGIEMDAPGIDGLYEIQGNGKEGFVVTRYSDAVRNGGQQQQEYEHNRIFKSRAAAKKWAEADYDDAVNAERGMSSSSARRLTGTTWDDKTPKDGTPTDDDPFQFDFSADDLSEIDLSGANLSNAELGGKNLAGAKLNDINGSKIDLTDADLTRVNMDRSDMIGAEMAGANLEQASLIQTDLTNANMDGANLEGANLLEARLENAYLREANLENAKLNAFLTDATLQGANLYGADMRDADLRGADLRDADLRNADLTGANLDGAVLTGADLDGAKLDQGWEQQVGMRSAKKPSNNDFDTSKFQPSLSDREDYIASDEYEADLEDWLTRFPRKTEADFRRSKTFMENVTTFNPGPDVSGFSRNGDPYDGWSREEIESGIPDTLWRGMGSRTSNLTPEGKRDINDATKKLSDFSRSSSFGDVYPGAEKFDSNNRMHQSIYDEFEDADMPSQRVQDVLNAIQALGEVFGEDSDVGMDDRMQYALDHIAPTFDSRLALSRGVRRRDGSVASNPGMGSRTSGAVRPAGFTQRSRTAMLERTAIGSPTGMRSGRENTKYKNVVPGQQRASTNDGKLWASLSPADKQLFAERARARESELIDMLFDRFDIPISGTDRRLLDDTLTPKERAKILKQTGGGLSWVTPNEESPGHFLLNEEGLGNILAGEYSVRKKAKELAKQAREHLAKGEMKEHKDTVTKLTTLLRLGDDLQTLAGARLQGEKDSTLIDKNDSYDFAIDHIHPVSRTRIMDVGSTTATKGKNSAPKEKTNTYSKSGSNRPFEFNFSKAQMTTPSTAINIPGRPESSKDDLLRSAGVPGDDVKIKKASRVGGFLDFLRMKVADLSKADEKARERRIKKMRAAGINVGSVEVGGKPKLLDKREMKISRIARKKLLNAKARKMDALEKSAEKNNNAQAIIASTESGATMLTPGGITALARKLTVGEKEWKKTYRNEGRNKAGHALAFVWGAAGMNGTPHSINEEEFKELLAAGWKPIKRGTGTRGYGLSYLDLSKRHLPEQGEAYGPGEYWSTGSNNSWTGSQYYPEPNGLLGDGPGGLAGLLPPTAKIMTAAELETIRKEHRKFAPAILKNISGYPEGELEKAPQQDFVDQLVSDVFGEIPRDSAVWDSAIGQMTLQLISALESNPSPQEYAKLRDALFRLTALVNQQENVYGPIFGADALDMGSDVILVMNRAAVSTFADPLPVAEILSLSRGEGLSPGYAPPGRK
jgi:uncharacterized protein YjbI with pentapeptide repeats